MKNKITSSINVHNVHNEFRKMPMTILGRMPLILFLLTIFHALYDECAAEPIIINGKMVPDLIGQPVSHIRIINGNGECIPFQVDECTEEGEYFCDKGKNPNSDSANGILDPYDEIVFLKNDCDECSRKSTEHLDDKKNRPIHELHIDMNGSCRKIYCTVDSTMALSEKKYITYNHEDEYLQTNRYYAQFGKDRFYFRRAGIIDPKGNSWIHLTRELRVEIMLKALWGLLPIHYTEESMVCYVQRFKVGPVRLIRRGDFHLNIGLGVRGSRAAVNQICYPELVQVPVKVHVPFRLGTLFKEAWIEVTPVIDSAGIPFSFLIPNCEYVERTDDTVRCDTLIPCRPDKNYFAVMKDRLGIGWVLTTTIDSSLTKESGYVARKPSSRNGPAEYGYRLQLRDLPGGYYAITNWVMFTEQSQRQLKQTFNAITHPVTIKCENNSAVNLIKGSEVGKEKKNRKES